jgi:dihydrofolate synthase / folylpolyglutamate synthase
MKLSPEYQAALDYLYSFVDFSMTKGQVYTPETYNLVNMRTLLEEMHNPHLAFPVIHIAGSKGKGSTAAMLASILQQAGYKVGLYTSPHLIDFNERIQINGEPIAHERFVSLLDGHKPIIESIKRNTTFEISTALAFEYFRQEQVDIAVIEVGLGGRLDSTNLVQPLLTVITSISLDHTSVLGNTVEEIATEKAGILKNGVPLVLAHQVPNVNAHIKQLADERGCEVMDVDSILTSTVMDESLAKQHIQYKLNSDISDLGKHVGLPLDIGIPLVGRHQIDNAGTSLLCALWLADHGYRITRETIQHGFERTNWPGRFEILSQKPLIIADSAHNPDSIARLKDTIREYLPNYQVKMIFGASEDKNIEEMLSILDGVVDHFIFTESIHPRAIQASKLAQFGDKIGLSYEICLPIENAVNSQMKNLSEHEVCIATGSIFVAAAAKEELISIENLSQEK